MTLAVKDATGATQNIKTADDVITALAGLSTDAKLEAVRALLAGALAVTAQALPLPAGAATDAKVEAVRALLAAPLTFGLPAGAASDATLQAILTKLGTARVETLWTDDTGVFFVRVDSAGVISWSNTSGVASAAPGAGARPAAGSTVLLDKSSYQATTAAAGYAIGDLIDHLVTTDPQTGVIIGHFWLNLTQETAIPAPIAANLTPLSPLGAGASTAALQLTGNGSLAAIVTALAGSLAITAQTLPLPAGAATSAKQDAATAGIQALAASSTYALVTPSDTVALAAVTRAITIGGAGNLSVKRPDGTTIGPIPVVAGQTLAIAASFVMATGTTATGILAQF